MTAKNKILVTGGAGFLGSHLCQRLLEKGHTVYCLDNLYTGTDRNLNTLSKFSDFEFIHQDVCNPIHLKVDAIYHLACPASPIHYQRDPIQTTKTSVLGALNVLDLAKHCRAPVLFSSTSEVYGDPHVHPQCEEYWGNVNSAGPRSCYDEGKRCAESLFMDYHRMHHVDIRIARIFNTYGPQMCANDGRVISNFIVQALQNKDITIYGNGEQSRSFCYVDDLILGLMRLMETPKLHSPVNIGNPIEKSMNEIAKIIINLTGSRSSISYHALPIDDPKQRCPDITKAKELLNWEPIVPLETGLRKTIAYFQAVLVESQSVTQ
ncbi:MAG: SDR family oxidoreductase [Gammaproteobacteria bacterium]|jgi:UDP-glucuronate decarboxylase|nr:SDR family oxidoreductase [Gammaproteobacteria bacterium]